MDNEDKVEQQYIIQQLILESEQSMLSDAGGEYGDHPPRYNVHEEFGKTARNKNWRVRILILLLLVCCICGATLMYFFTEKHYADTSVDILLIQTTDLREHIQILIRQFRNEISRAKNEREILTNRLNARLKELEENYFEDINNLLLAPVNIQAKEQQKLEERHILSREILNEDYLLRIHELEVIIEQTSKIQVLLEQIITSSDEQVLGELELRRLIIRGVEQHLAAAINEHNLLIDEKLKKQDEIQAAFVARINDLQLKASIANFQDVLRTLRQEQVKQQEKLEHEYDVKITQHNIIVMHIRNLLSRLQENLFID